MESPLTYTLDHTSARGSVCNKKINEIMGYGKHVVDQKESSFDSDNCNFREVSMEEKIGVKEYQSCRSSTI